MATESDSSSHEDLHHVPESWWLPAVGLSTIFIGLAIFLIGKSLIPGFSITINSIHIPFIGIDIGLPINVYLDSAFMFVIGFFLVVAFFATFAGAMLAEISPNKFARREREVKFRKEELTKNPRGFAKFSFMWMFLASETMFFTLVIGASLVIRIQTDGYAIDGGWHPTEVLNTFLTAINTFILIVSSYTMVKAVQTIENGDVQTEIPIIKNISALASIPILNKLHGEKSKTGLYLFATFLLGLLFVLIQAIEYIALWGEGFRPGFLSGSLHHIDGLNSYFPATFYLQTGFHGLHVFFGVFIMFFVSLKAFKGGYNKDNYDSIELVGYYWHFVDLVWVILFTVVYLF